MNKKQKGSVELQIILILMSLVIFIASANILNLKKDVVSFQSHDSCIEALYETGIDPNDTEERSSFLKNCIDR